MISLGNRLAGIFAALVLLAPAAATAGTETWRRADTPNFIIYSTGSEKQLKEFAEDVERFDALLHRFANVEAQPTPYRLTIYALPNASAVRKLLSGKNRDVAGFYHPSLAGSFAVTNRSGGNQKFDLDGSIVLFHEYAHHFMHRNFNGSFPLWFNEGFAEYYSTTTFDKNGRYTVGKPAYHRAYGLLLGVDVGIEKLLLTSDLENLKRDERDPFYGRSWLLVHWLMRDEEGRKKLLGYLNDCATGVPLDEAAMRNFGDLKELDKALDAALSGRMPMMTSKDPMDFQTKIKIRTVDDVESAIVPLHLQRLSGKEIAKVVDGLRLLADQNPARADVWYELAQAELASSSHAYIDDTDINDEDGTDDARLEEVPDSTLIAAESSLDKALAIAPRHSRANTLKAHILMERLQRSGDVLNEDWEDVRTHIIAANHADTEDPMPLIAWYESYTKMGKTPTAIASDGLAKAFGLAREATEVRLLYAFDLARMGKYDLAANLVEVLVNDPHAGDVGRAALARLDAMRREGAISSAPSGAD